MDDPLNSPQSPLEVIDAGLLDAAWELPELAIVSILVSIGLLTLGGVLFGISQASALNDPGFGTPLLWIGVQVAVRWLDPATTALLLGALAICWWQYGEWTIGDQPANAHATVAHVRRLRVLSRWLEIAFVVAIVAATLSVVAGIIVNASNSGLRAYDWGNDIYTFCSSLAVVVIAGLGLVAGRRVERAALVHLARRVDITTEDETLN